MKLEIIIIVYLWIAKLLIFVTMFFLSFFKLINLYLPFDGE